MKQQHYSSKVTVRSLFLLVFFVFPVLVSAQNLPAEGMQTKSNNFTSFTAARQGNLSDWKKYNAPSDYDHPEFGFLPKDAPCQNCVEDLSKRTADVRHFIDLENPSKFYQQTAMGELSALVDGDWVTIDHTLDPLAEGVFESSYGAEPAGFNALESRSYIRTNHGTIHFNSWQLFTVTGGVETSYGLANWSNYTVGEDGMHITDIFPGIDAEMIVFRGAIKTNFILKQNLYGTFDELVFRDVFTAPGATSVQFAEQTGTEGIGRLHIFSGNTEVLEMGESVLFAKDGPKELVASGVYRISGNAVDVVVPFDWINDNIGSYNLIVDPIVTGTNTLAQASITGSQYNASCNFTNSCNFNMNVNRPANATVTNVAWTFTYTANGSTCWLQDGAIRIASGACVSPATAGFYWFCNAIGGGTCTGNNQTIFGDMAACMPAPSCAAVSVPFQLRFYRSCWGAAGCNNACIGAGSPWTMTITGMTLEYTAPVNPITLSATTICAGGSITASTTGAYGVPGYTYNWSFSPTGVPSVGSGASTSITFPTAGSVTLYSIVTDACGNQVTSSRAVTVTSGPVINVNSPTICAGSSAVLTATGGTTYAWSPAGGLSATTGSSVTASPAATTVYTVTGTTSGCSGTATATVTVNPAPVINVNSATICSGGSATLTATGATSYTWSPAGGLSATTGSSVTANPAATTVYTVTGTTSGCTGTATSTVTVNLTPVINVNSPTICAGGSATLTATGATSYTWSPAGGLSATTGSSVTATPAATTVYTVTGTDNGCTGTATATVTVNANPVVNVNSETICSGGSATLTATGATSYTWSPATGLSATTGSTVTATPAATTVYTVTGTDNGCTGTATSTVTVNPTPVVNVPAATICAGGSATLNASGATTYAWSPATGLSATSGSSVTATPAATTTYTVDGTTNGCVGTTTVTVTVNPNPVVNVNSPTICAGGSAVLNATGATSYAWSPPGGLSATTGSSVTANPAATTVYTVTGTTNGCTGTATATVTVTPNPVVNVNSATICDGSSATLTATGATTYAWSPATGLSATTGSPVTASPATTTTYTVTGTTNGCSSTVTATVTVNPMPTPVAGNNGPLCPGDQLALTCSATAGASYSWSGPNGFSSGAQNPFIASITAADAGTYTVTVTLNGCSATATTTLALNPGLSTAINPAGPFCINDAPVVLTAVNPGGVWSGTGITNTNTGAFDPSLCAVGSNTITYDLPGGCGGPSSISIQVNPLPNVSFAANVVTGCAPLQVTFTDQSLTPGVAVLWNFGNGATSVSPGTANATYNAEGCYDVSLTSTSNLGCVATHTLNDYICVLPEPNASFSAGDQQATLSNPAFQFLNTSSNAVSYQWEFGDGSTSASLNPSHTYAAEPGNYTVTLTVTNSGGCTDVATLTVEVIEELIYFIPNSFTPDGNEYNNTFQPVFTSGFDPFNFSFVIYNRWGETLFESKDHTIGWDGTYDGKMAPEGTYTWSVWFKDTRTDKKYQETGKVTLLK